MTGKLNLLGLLLAFLLAGYNRPSKPEATGHLYAVDVMDAQYVYVARHLDGIGFKQGLDYVCNVEAGSVCIVFSKDSLPSSRKLHKDKVRIITEGRFLELQVSK